MGYSCYHSVDSNPSPTFLLLYRHWILGHIEGLVEFQTLQMNQAGEPRLFWAYDS